ncbi:hypothetical protein IVA80_20115 [Bradyrhizobium sp. 139]|nr:hypothetical protein [Bradyrhizobium sp. 139]
MPRPFSIVSCNCQCQPPSRNRVRGSEAGAGSNGTANSLRKLSYARLDARLRVRGVEALRLWDVSALPNINAGNTNAPAMMMGFGARSSSAGS